MLSLKLLKISLKETFSLRLIKLMIIPFLIYYFADNFGENAFIRKLDFLEKVLDHFSIIKI